MLEQRNLTAYLEGLLSEKKVPASTRTRFFLCSFTTTTKKNKGKI
jgi:hypothetical protein